jgi:hypothetical protein
MDELFNTPEMYYNAQYFLHLMCPDGMIPDFSDSNWRSNWVRYLVFFEAVAKAYHDPHLKRAAATIAQKFIAFDQIQNTGLAIEIQHGKNRLSLVPNVIFAWIWLVTGDVPNIPMNRAELNMVIWKRMGIFCLRLKMRRK